MCLVAVVCLADKKLLTIVSSNALSSYLDPQSTSFFYAYMQPGVQAGAPEAVHAHLGEQQDSDVEVIEGGAKAKVRSLQLLVLIGRLGVPAH